LVPKGIQAFAALWRQGFKERTDLLPHPQPFLWDHFLELLEGSAHPAADMEMADLMAEIDFLCHSTIAEQIFGNDHRDPMMPY
jgi:hypothetical protein